jgi:phage major head subunit gpT-like protein
MAVITQALLSAIFTGYKTAFTSGFAGVTPDWNKVAMTVPSTTAAENYGWLGQMPRMREWIGDRVIGQLETYDYQIKNRTFESTIGLKREMVEDDQYGILSPMMTELGRSTAAFPDELVFGALANGFSNLCFDKQFFFDTDHPVLDELGNPYTVSNMQAGAGPAWYLLDMSRVIKPVILQQRRAFEFVNKSDPRNSDHVFMTNGFLYGTDGRLNTGYGFWQLAYASKAALNLANFRAARLAMTTLKADMGRPLGVRPTLLVVPTILEDAARDLLFKRILPGGEENTEYKAVELLVSPWLPNV